MWVPTKASNEHVLLHQLGKKLKKFKTFSKNREQIR